MPLIVYGSSMPFLQSQKFGEINIRARDVINASLKGKCQIVGGVLEKECNQLFQDSGNILAKISLDSHLLSAGQLLF